MSTKYVVLHESSENALERAPSHHPAHSERLASFHEAGKLEAVGPFGDPQGQGSMAIFTTREVAEEFIAGNPFVLSDVVSGYEIGEWTEAYS